MTRIHSWATQHYFSRFPKYIALPIRLVMGLLWPFRLAQHATVAVKRHGATIQIQSGQGITKQFIEHLWNGLYHKLLPVEYCRYRLYTASGRTQLSNYLLQHEVTALTQLNTAGLSKKIQCTVADKKAFEDFCINHGLPTVPVLQSISKHTSSKLGTNTNPHCSLFIKQRHGLRGENAMLWSYNSAKQNYVKHPDGLTASWPELMLYLWQHAQHNELLIQPCLDNHPTLTALCGNALASLRILTALRPDGNTEVIAATFKMPFLPHQIHSTYSLNSPVNLDTGQLGTAYLYHPLSPEYDQHPMSRKAIKGQILPDWPEASELVLNAHQLLKGYVFLGWDVALTPTGPVLLETNAGWDVATIQHPQQHPLGQTRFTDICQMWLDKSVG